VILGQIFFARKPARGRRVFEAQEGEGHRFFPFANATTDYLGACLLSVYATSKRMSIRRKTIAATPPRGAAEGDGRFAAVLATGLKTVGPLPAVFVGDVEGTGAFGGGRARVTPLDGAPIALPEVERLRAEAERLQRQVASVSGELAACRASGDMLKSDREANKQELERRLEKIVELADESNARGELNAALQAARDEIKRRSEQDEAILRTEYAELEARFVDAEEGRVATEQDLQSAKREITEAQERIEQLQKQKSNVAERSSSDFFELSEALLDAQRRLDEALETVKAARAESAAAQVQVNDLRVEGQALRDQWSGLQEQIDRLLSQVQNERESARDSDELEAFKNEIGQLRLAMGEANPEKYASELRFAISEFDVKAVKRLLAYGANIYYDLIVEPKHDGYQEVERAQNATVSKKQLVEQLLYPGTISYREYEADKAIAIIDLLVAAKQTLTPDKWTLSLGLLHRDWNRDFPKVVPANGHPERRLVRQSPGAKFGPLPGGSDASKLAEEHKQIIPQMFRVMQHALKPVEADVPPFYSFSNVTQNLWFDALGPALNLHLQDVMNRARLSGSNEDDAINYVVSMLDLAEKAFAIGYTKSKPSLEDVFERGWYRIFMEGSSAGARRQDVKQGPLDYMITGGMDYQKALYNLYVQKGYSRE
jgi:hypothetical protein